jgi:hypothetical protein
MRVATPRPAVRKTAWILACASLLALSPSIVFASQAVPTFPTLWVPTTAYALTLITMMKAKGH